MKTIKNIGALSFLFVLVLAASCSGDDSEGVNNNTPDGEYVHGKADGVQFETVNYQGLTSVFASKDGTGEETQIIVVGNDLEGNAIGLTTHGIATTGTYELNDLQAVMLYTDGATGTNYDTSDDCEGGDGTLTVTYLDDIKIEGTFEFVGKNDENCSQSKTVTEGSFRGVFETE